jgi:hypothetical protein
MSASPAFRKAQTIFWSVFLSQDGTKRKELLTELRTLKPDLSVCECEWPDVVHEYDVNNFGLHLILSVCFFARPDLDVLGIHAYGNEVMATLHHGREHKAAMLPLPRSLMIRWSNRTSFLKYQYHPAFALHHMGERVTCRVEGGIKLAEGVVELVTVHGLAQHYAFYAYQFFTMASLALYDTDLVRRMAFCERAFESLQKNGTPMSALLAGYPSFAAAAERFTTDSRPRQFTRHLSAEKSRRQGIKPDEVEHRKCLRQYNEWSVPTQQQRAADSRFIDQADERIY